MQFMETTLEEVEKKTQKLKSFFTKEVNDLKTIIGNIQHRINLLERDQTTSVTSVSEMVSKEVNKINIAPIIEHETRCIAKDEIDKSDIISMVDARLSTVSVNHLDCNSAREQQDTKIAEVNDKVNSLKNDTITISSSSYERKLQELEVKVNTLSSSLQQHPIQPPVIGTSASIPVPSHRYRTDSSNNNVSNDEVDLLICFDSNWQFINPRKLWKVNGSIVKRCSTLFDVSKVVHSFPHSVVKHFLLNVGTNDLDEKDHHQVFGELEQVVDAIRTRYPGIQMVISEIPPRKDTRDEDVINFNELLRSYAANHTDITIALHHNLRDESYSMFYDNKHIKEIKVPKFAKNIIRAMLKSYKITDKRELYPEANETPSTTNNGYRGIQRRPLPQNNNQHKPDLADRIRNIAGYNNGTPTSLHNNKGGEEFVRGVLLKMLQGCIT